MTFGQRFLLTLAIVLIILFAFAAWGYFTGRWQDDESNAHVWGMASAESRPELCMDSEARERVRKIMLDALDESLHEKIKDLMDVWLRDATGQPQRASKGLENAMRAYFHARGAAMKFNPPECSG